MKAALILQPFGLGDCIFCQTIAQRFIQNGYKIYWPVIPQYLFDLQRAYPNVRWCLENFADLTKEEAYDVINATAVPIRWSDTLMQTSYKNVMRAKYEMYDIHWANWRMCAMWRRDMTKEFALYDALGLESGAKYTLVCDLFTAKFTARQLNINNGTKIVRLVPLNGYSLFDWASVIERAHEIHAVASSNIYIFEMLKLKTKLIYLYSRQHNASTHPHYDYILQQHKYELK